MATTAEYLAQLQVDKQALVDNLAAKGVEVTNDETFTTLVPKVADISTGVSDKIYDAGYLFYDNRRINLAEDLCKLIDNSCESFMYMFNSCDELIDVPSFSTSNGKILTAMFSGCKNVKKINIDTRNATNLNYLCNGCELLEEITGLDTSNATSADNIFNGCKSLTTIPPLNIQNITNLTQAFNNSGLTSLTLLNTGNLTTLYYFIYNANSLVSLSEIDGSKVTTCSSQAFRTSSLINFGGIKDLGKAYLPTQSANDNNYSISFTNCPKLSEESLISILNNLYDIASAGCQTQKVILGTTNLAKLTSDAGQLAIENATAKGWTVS